MKRIAQIIHDADLGDEKFGRPEALGLDKVLNGWGKPDCLTMSCCSGAWILSKAYMSHWIETWDAEKNCLPEGQSA